MTRSTAALRLALAIASVTSPLALATSVGAQEPTVTAESYQDEQLYTVEELDNLLAPVALYPDPILAQLLIAATYPEQLELAARYVATYGTEGIDDQAWDVSVKSVAHYAPVLNMLVERPNWATALGRAYALQPGDVMASVQSLRRMARAQGNLVSTSEQRVEVERDAIRIVPAQPRVIYVPVYEPEVIYYRPVNYVSVRTPYWSFGMGYPIGGWLAYDLDWSTQVVYYHGWNGYGRRHTWYHDSRPYIVVNAIYISPRRSVIVINRNIVHRRVAYDGFDRYNSVHRRTSWDRRDLPGRGQVGRGQYSKPVAPDRYGIPTRRDVGVYKPDKRDDRNVVPRVGSSAPRGNNGGARPPRGGNDDRPNVPGDRPGNRPGNGNNGSDRSGIVASANRVTPVRVGGNSRPLYPSGEDISADRVRGGSVPRRETSSGNGNTDGNGSWNARPGTRSAEPSPMSPKPDRNASRSAPAPRSNAPRYEGTDQSRNAPRYEGIDQSRSAPRYEGIDQSRNAQRYEGIDQSRSAPRVSAPRNSAPRASSEPRMNVPRASAPRESAPRMSAPRSSAPRVSAPRSSAPRASAPRESGSRASAPRASSGSGSASKPAKGGRGRD